MAAALSDFILQCSLDLFDHLGILCIGQLTSAGIHGKGGTPLEFILVFGYQVEMQMAAAIAVGTVVDLIGMECLMDGLCGGGHIGKEEVTLFITDVHQLRHMILVCHDDNKIMQRAVAKYGFQRAGIIHLANGSPRIAYDLLIQ